MLYTIIIYLNQFSQQNYFKIPKVSKYSPKFPIFPQNSQYSQWKFTALKIPGNFASLVCGHCDCGQGVIDPNALEVHAPGIGTWDGEEEGDIEATETKKERTMVGIYWHCGQERVTLMPQDSVPLGTWEGEEDGDIKTTEAKEEGLCLVFVGSGQEGVTLIPQESVPLGTSEGEEDGDIKMTEAEEEGLWLVFVGSGQEGVTLISWGPCPWRTDLGGWGRGGHQGDWDKDGRAMVLVCWYWYCGQERLRNTLSFIWKQHIVVLFVTRSYLLKIHKNNCCIEL